MGTDLVAGAVEAAADLVVVGAADRMRPVVAARPAEGERMVVDRRAVVHRAAVVVRRAVARLAVAARTDTRA